MRATGTLLLMIYQKTVAIFSSLPGAMQAILLLSTDLSVLWLASVYYSRESAGTSSLRSRGYMANSNRSLMLKTNRVRRKRHGVASGPTQEGRNASIPWTKGGKVLQSFELSKSDFRIRLRFPGTTENVTIDRHLFCSVIWCIVQMPILMCS